MPDDGRFLAADSREVFTGNELLVKGCLETEGGVGLLTGYPGSPVAAFFDALADVGDLLKQKGIRAFQANNEALAVAAVNGSQMLPVRAVAAMKSVGVHVAADALALGNLAGAHPEGGAIIMMGDDPWCDSTQVAADSRFLCQHLRMPVVEPGNPQQVKDFIGASFKLSQAGGFYIGYIVTPAQVDGGGSVWCRPNQFPQVNRNERQTLDTTRIDLDKVLLPPRTWQHELELPGRIARTLAAARELGINRIIRKGLAGRVQGSGFREQGTDVDAGIASLGFIVTGMGGAYLEHVLVELGLAGAFPILQMGMSYPVDAGLVREFSRLCRNMIVIEERRSFLEKNIRDELFRTLSQDEAAEVSSRLYGKRFPGGGEGFPDVRGLNYSIVAQKVIALVETARELPPHMRDGRLSAETLRITETGRVRLPVIAQQIIPRTPTFCPGCPHRDSAAALLELRRNLADASYMQRHGRGPVDLVAHGDTGCYTMLMFPPPSSSCTTTAAWAWAAAPARASIPSSPTSRSSSWATARSSIPARSPSPTR